MPSRIIQFFRTIRLKRILLFGALAVLAAFLFLAVLVLALPSLLSTQAGQAMLRSSLSKSLNREVSWSELVFSWSDGLSIKGLALGPGQAPMLKAAAGDAIVVAKIGYRDGRMHADLKIRVSGVNADLAPGPPKPPAPYKEPLTAAAEALQRFQAMDWPLPIDLSLKLAVDPVKIAYRDPQSNRKVTLSNGSLVCDVPSLADRPVTAKVRGDLDVDGHRIEALSVTADLKKLVTTARHVHPAAALIAVEAAAPGTSVTLQGGLQETGGLTARARLDLPRLMSVAGPFVPANLPALQGQLALYLQGKVDAANTLQLDLAVTGSRIAMGGGGSSRGMVGPLDLQFKQKVGSDLKRQQVRLTGGSLTVDNWLAAGWQADIDRPSSKDRELSARFGPARVDVGRLFTAAGPILSANADRKGKRPAGAASAANPSSPPKPEFPVRELAGELKLDQVSILLTGRKNKGEVAISKLGLNLPRLRLALPAGGITAEGIEFGIDRMTAPLSGFKPTAVAASLSYAVGRAAMTGKEQMNVDGVRGGVQLKVTDLDLKSPSPRKVSGNAEVTEVLDVRRVKMAGTLDAETLHGLLATRVLLKKNGEMEVPSPRIELTAAALKAFSSGKTITAIPLAATVTAAGITLPARQGTSPAVARVACTLKSAIEVSQSRSVKVPSGRKPGIETILAKLPLTVTATVAGIRLPAQKGAPLAVERAECALRGELAMPVSKIGRPSASGGSPKAVPKAQSPASRQSAKQDSNSAPDAARHATSATGETFATIPLSAAVTVMGIRQPGLGGAPLSVDRVQGNVHGELEMLLRAAVGSKSPGKGPGSVPLVANLSAAGIHLPVKKGALPSLERAACSVSGGDFLALEATASVSGASPQKAVSNGTLRMDLDRLLPVAAPFLPKGVAAGGKSSLAWTLSVLPAGAKAPPPGKNPLAAAKGYLSMVERADIDMILANRAISYPLAGGSFSLTELRTSAPVRVVVSSGAEKISLDGGLSFAGLSRVPASAGTFPSQSGTLSFSGQLTNWQNARLHEELKLQQFGINHKADAAISRLDTLMEKQAKISAASLLQGVDAAVTTEFAAHFPATPTPVPGGAKLSGDLSGTVRLNLVGGRDLKISASAKTRDFGARLSNGTTIEGMRGELLVDRSYAMARRSTAGWTPLSASLVRPAPEQFGAGGAPEIVSRVREDLQGQEVGSRRFYIKRIAVTSGGVPVDLTSLEGDLMLTTETMGVTFLQTELLGGTMRLRGLIDLKPEVPALSADCSFSNLETFLLLSPETRKSSRTDRRQTQITGELSLAVPLATGERELLEGNRMRINLRKIGADTLERALFSLDPYERNEQIVAQRKMLRLGSLKGLRASTRDGAFSMEGEVRVKGIDLALPKVDRIRLSELALKKQLAGTIAGITAARKGLDLVRADTIVVGRNGEISLVRRGHEQ